MEVSERDSHNWIMNAKTLLKIALLTLALMIVAGIASGIVGVSSEGLVEDASQIMGITLLVFFLQTAALSLPIIRSNLNNRQLILLIAGLYFGISIFLVQIETLVFMNYFTGIIDSELIGQLIIQGTITAIIFAPIAVLVLRGRKPTSKIDSAFDLCDLQFRTFDDGFLACNLEIELQLFRNKKSKFTYLYIDCGHFLDVVTFRGFYCCVHNG